MLAKIGTPIQPLLEASREGVKFCIPVVDGPGDMGSTSRALDSERLTQVGQASDATDADSEAASPGTDPDIE